MGDVYSNRWGADFASILKRLEQEDKVGVVTGKVIQTTPLTLSILSGDAILNPSIQNVFVTETLKDKILSGYLVVGDIVLVVPNEVEKVFYAIDIMSRE